MSLLKDIRKAAAAGRLVEEQMYEYVARELQAGMRRQGLWVKAIEKGLGDEGKAKALYIQYRIQSLRDEAELLTASPKTPVREPTNPLDAYDENGHTALMRAVKAKDVSTVGQLLEQGADPTIVDNTFGTSTALTIAKRALALAPDDQRAPLTDIINMLRPLTDA